MKFCKLISVVSVQSALQARWLWVGMLAAVLAIPFTSTQLLAADGDEAERTAVGQFITITSPVDDQVASRVTNAALKLQALAVQDGRPAFLVLQIEPGTSPFHHVLGLAKFLTSSKVSNVTTVAWIPQTVTGPNAVLALACRQIIMHQDAELGDINRGAPMDPIDRQGVLAIAQKRHNPRVNVAIARGMMDANEQLWKVRLRSTEPGKDDLESRVVTKDELDELRKTTLAIEGIDVVKEAGMLGVFRGATARNMNILVSQTADSRAAVCELLGLPRESMREQTVEREARNVRLIRLDGVIDQLQESFIVRQIERAVAGGAQVIVFQIDSPGGYLSASFSLSEAIMNLEQNKVRTIAYVPREAISGAAIVALGCDEIIMHPTAKIGDAGPIQMTQGMFERAPEKILSMMLVMMGDLATRKHRPVALCKAMADRKAKVFEVSHRDNGRVWYMDEQEIQDSAGEWIMGRQLPETNGELLFTANGERAHKLKLADSPVHDISELKVRLGLPASAELKPIAMTWVDSLVFWLNSPAMTVVLVSAGVILIYVELQMMTGLLGILSCLCFSLFFWSRALGGTADWLEVVLFVLGAGCLALEFFVIPGFGVFGVSGILLVLASLVLACQAWSFDLATNLEEIVVQTGWVSLAFVMVGVIGIAAARYLPQLPMFENLILSPSATTEPQLRLETGMSEMSLLEAMLIGEHGVAVTMLRPAGKARLNNRVIDVVSEGPFVAPEATIEVIAIRGNKVVVRELSKSEV
ncbi:MAG: hypothetical protein JSS49_23205 [Planctomycetes bacterium]|nr:hypothetical protein [Planctomycetota bacterium]